MRWSLPDPPVAKFALPHTYNLDEIENRVTDSPPSRAFLNHQVPAAPA
jgi:hypothetical protein